MPSKTIRIKLAERKAMLQLMDEALKNVPAHIRGRLGKSSILASALSKTGGYGWRAYKYSEAGEPIELMKRDRVNRNRHSEAVNKAQELAQRYAHIWDTPGAAEIIARREGMRADTVRRYRRQLRTN